MDDKAIDRRRHNFTITDNEIIDGISQIGVSAFAVYSVIIRMANDQNKCFPGQKYIAAVTGLSERTVRTAISLLTERDLIRITRTSGFQNTYTILPVKKTPRQKDTPANISEPRKPLPEGAATIAGGVRQPLPPNNTNITIPSNKTAAAPEKTERLTANDQAYIQMFAQIAALFNEADLEPTSARIANLRSAMHNVHIGGFSRILEAAQNLARSPAPDGMKRYDWLLHRFDHAERITEFLTAKNDRKPRPRKYAAVPDDWRPDADATATA